MFGFWLMYNLLYDGCCQGSRLGLTVRRRLVLMLPLLCAKLVKIILKGQNERIKVDVEQIIGIHSNVFRTLMLLFAIF